MDGQIFFIRFPGTNPEENLAAEKRLFSGRRETFILLWRNAPCVVIGCNQDMFAETTEQCRAEVPVLRRITGGGAVYHDLDNINFSIIRRNETADPMQTYLTPVLEVLRTFGLDVSFSGRNDILLNGRKVSGTAMRQSGERMLLHGTLLFRRDGEKMEAYLTPSAEKLSAHQVASVRERTGEIAEYLPQYQTTEEFMNALEEAILLKFSDAQKAVIEQFECR